jgi:hypothetical protein
MFIIALPLSWVNFWPTERQFGDEVGIREPGVVRPFIHDVFFLGLLE